MNALPALPAIRKYFFGYLFVRLAKTLAVLVLLGGLTGAGLEYVNTILANATQRYVPGPALTASLERLSAEWGRVRSLIEGLRPANAPAATAPAPTAMAFQPAFPLRPTDAGDFARLRAELDRLDAARGGAKTLMLSRFDALAGNVEERLRGFAARLSAEQAAAATAAAPSSPGPAAATPSPTPSSPAPNGAAAAVAVETLYSPSLRRGDVDERRGTLGRGREFFNVLAASAENPENQATLRDAAGELERLANLLPAPVVVEEFIAPPAPARRTTAAGSSSVPPAPPVNALKVAEQVARLRSAVRAALLTSWRLDEYYDEAVSLAESERTRSAAAAALVRARWVLAAGQIGLRIAVGLALAFLVLVAADLLQTFFDTATNTGVSAAAVSGGRPEERRG